APSTQKLLPRAQNSRSSNKGKISCESSFGISLASTRIPQFGCELNPRVHLEHSFHQVTEDARKRPVGVDRPARLNATLVTGPLEPPFWRSFSWEQPRDGHGQPAASPSTHPPGWCWAH